MVACELYSLSDMVDVTGETPARPIKEKKMTNPLEYAEYFETGQYGRLYISLCSHARGISMRIYVLPEGVVAKFNGHGNPPANDDVVEVYGVSSEQPGWAENYGWLHEGKWQDDFYALAEERAKIEKERRATKALENLKAIADKNRREKELLSSY